MEKMNKEAATAYVVKQLSKQRRHNDIIAELCERTGGNWQQVQKFVYQVAFEQKKEIAKKQSPIMIFFGLGAIVLGLILAIGLGVSAVQGVYYSLNGVPGLGTISGLVTGLGLIAGGVIGLMDWIKSFFE